MNALTFRRYAEGLAACAILAACTTAGGPSQLPRTGNEALPPNIVSQRNVSGEKVLYAFKGGSDGAVPHDDGLVADGDGNLYGTTSIGGSANAFCSARSGCGTVFEMVRSENRYTEKILYAFTGPPDGAGVEGGNLISDESSTIYGATIVGGTANEGTVFRLARADGRYTEKILYSFKGSPDGAEPIAGPISDAEGNLYGTTYYGGTSGVGTVYELTPSHGSYTERVLYSFQNNGSDGVLPTGKLVIDRRGALYGMTEQGGGGPCGSVGCGSVFKLIPSKHGFKEAIIYAFQLRDGAVPFNGGLTPDGPRVFYGTTEAGGRHRFGTAFRLTGSGIHYTFKVVHSFAGGPSDGSSPQGTLTLRNGYLYGTTVQGGKYSMGVAFQLTPAGSEEILHNFAGGSDGSGPYGGVLVDKEGIFGTTEAGGYAGCHVSIPGCGILFEIR